MYRRVRRVGITVEEPEMFEAVIGDRLPVFIRCKIFFWFEKGVHYRKTSGTDDALPPIGDPLLHLGRRVSQAGCTRHNTYNHEYRAVDSSMFVWVGNMFVWVGNQFLSLPSKGSEDTATARLDPLWTDGKLDSLLTEAANGMSFEIGSGSTVTLVLEVWQPPKSDLQLQAAHGKKWYIQVPS